MRVDLHHELMIVDIFWRSLEATQVSDLYEYLHETSIWSEASWSHWSASSLTEIISWWLKIFFSLKTLLERKKKKEEDDLYARDHEKNTFFSFLSKIHATNFYDRDIRILSNFWINKKEKLMSKLGQKMEEKRPQQPTFGCW